MTCKIKSYSYGFARHVHLTWRTWIGSQSAIRRYDARHEYREGIGKWSGPDGVVDEMDITPLAADATLGGRKASGKRLPSPGKSRCGSLGARCRLVTLGNPANPAFLQPLQRRLVADLELGKAGAQHQRDLVDEDLARGADCALVAVPRAQELRLRIAAPVTEGREAERNERQGGKERHNRLDLLAGLQMNADPRCLFRACRLVERKERRERQDHAEIAAKRLRILRADPLVVAKSFLGPEADCGRVCFAHRVVS